ncbi:hypothetical protein JKP88DRAFT_349074 [Tribonema minus]|uniref:Uncharacterized protein n=1 Tax=Tribonema minus TaxID=303371 RepID=A0A835Z2R4_9STRA|nr:hypothetical protein JKP88DRAFT_349074 [Tribonema minus]
MLGRGYWLPVAGVSRGVRAAYTRELLQGGGDSSIGGGCAWLCRTSLSAVLQSDAAFRMALDLSVPAGMDSAAKINDAGLLQLLEESPIARHAVGKEQLSCGLIRDAVTAALPLDGHTLAGAAERGCEAALKQWHALLTAMGVQDCYTADLNAFRQAMGPFGAVNAFVRAMGPFGTVRTDLLYFMKENPGAAVTHTLMDTAIGFRQDEFVTLLSRSHGDVPDLRSVVSLASQFDWPWGPWTSAECEIMRSSAERLIASPSERAECMRLLHELGCPCHARGPTAVATTTLLLRTAEGARDDEVTCRPTCMP